jgi:hypothetical protein
LYDPAAEARAKRKQQLRFWEKLLPVSSSTGDLVAWGPCMPGVQVAALTAAAAVAVAGLVARSVAHRARQ